MQYRPEVDGLRAIAVIPVIFFHAGFGVFSGGFVGVDIFFVISGYLITTILLSEIDQGKFSLVRFYERRARRILPVLFFVMLMCLPFAWLLLMPRDMQEFGHSLIAVSSFSSNILFWLESDYFATAAELKPLLHTWSLAVEEQYYILFPLLLMLVWGMGKRWLLLILSLIFIISLALACVLPLIINHPKIISGNFYLLPTRGWELLVGSFAALYLYHAPPKFNHWANQLLSLLGLVLVMFAIFIFDKNTPFPSLYTLLPTVGTALIILFSAQGTLVYRLLSYRFFVAIGLISYSAYLWHQPIFAFIRYISLDDLPWLMMFFLCIAIFPLAYLSWKFIEAPFRNKTLISRRAIFSFSLLGCIVFIIIGFTIHQANGFKSRLSAQQLSLLSYQQYPRHEIYREGRCFLAHGKTYEAFAEDCIEKKTDILLWGDSHAAALYYGLHEHNPNISQLTASDCPPILNIDIASRPTCKDINDYVLGRVQEIKPKTIMLHATWSSYADDIALEKIKLTIEELRLSSPGVQIIIVGGVPHWQPDLPTVLLRTGIDLATVKYPATAIAQVNKVRWSDDLLMNYINNTPDVTFVSLLSGLCEGESCVSVVGDPVKEPIVWDYAHLTKTGSLVVAKYIIDQMENK